ncbi:dihydroxyacetone kinase subunit DhaK [Rhizobium sp. XQZ8]|uniref:dihydroxyacetone kinase family protein n=1 Tax=Rhizobium populisoli TaxID=2859785 RepID=UPI001CA5A6F0|nr:dihydroxyacetone kinase family protein [Rhizobium populisoli]MBW6422253.1 dihydroxyacetone kinase subunit DhaK [Rhizobium populisoli]
MKKLINNPRNVVREMLEGLVDLNPAQVLLSSEDVVAQAGLPGISERPVAVLSGGGAGHEPAHAGYVGHGMLTAAISGDVFTSPSVDAVLAAIVAVAGPKGAVLIVKNYTGDRLNFGLAAELATAQGIPTEVVVVADDAALKDIVEPARRRGIAGTILVHKIAGAAAAAGCSLAEVVAEARAAAASVVTMGVALGSCIVPAAGKPGFSLGEDEMELGLGIHGEQGVRRVPLEPADAIVDSILETLITDSGLTSGSRVALLVNGLGGTPPMELAIVARHAFQRLRDHGIVVERAWSGNFMTALEMPGMSLSLLSVDDKRLQRLDAEAKAPAWPGGGRIAPRKILETSIVAEPAAPSAVDGPLAAALKSVALGVASALERQEPMLTELDSRTGDGDLGISMARGAAAIRGLPEESWANPAIAFTAMGNALRRAIAGSSGPFYAVALLRAARELDVSSPENAAWARAFSRAVASVSELGGAKPGDRTMLDALQPAADAFASAIEAGQPLKTSWAAAVKAAEEGAEATAAMRPRLGRAAYLGDRAIGFQDAGAGAVVVWMKAMLESP